eukprot:gene20110-7177_t
MGKVNAMSFFPYSNSREVVKSQNGSSVLLVKGSFDSKHELRHGTMGSAEPLALFGGTNMEGGRMEMASPKYLGLVFVVQQRY